MNPSIVSQRKTRRVAHYIISHTQPWQLGATKLCKVMWYADVLHYRRHGHSVSGQKSYVRMDNGPVPNDIYQALESLMKSKKIVERRTPTPVGDRKEFLHLERAEASWFSPEEVETLHESIDAIVPLSAKEASERTHGPIWEELANGEQMPIRAAAVIPSDVLPGDLAFALEHKAAFTE